MNRDRNRLYILCALFAGVQLLLLFLPRRSWIALAIALASVCFAVFTATGVKKRSLLSIHKREIAVLVFFTACVFAVIYYLSGLHFGFYPSVLPRTAGAIGWRLSVLGVLTVSSEVIRGIFLAQGRKASDVLSFAALFLLSVWMRSDASAWDSFYGLVDFLALAVFPAVTENLLYHYLSRRYGAMPNILYRTVLLVCPYLLPYTPAIPIPWIAFFYLLAPLLVYLFLFILYEKKQYAVSGKKRGIRVFGSVISLALMVALVILVSCRARYGVIVVGSESMTGAADKGDALIYERYEDQIIREGEIVIFVKDGKRIIHRVARIRRVNGELRYYTKGDANDKMDEGYVVDDALFGIAKLRLAHIGYPSVFLREWLAELSRSK